MCCQCLYFVDQANELNGSEFLLYNVHSLVHQAAVAKRYGNLDSCSGFCFENHLQDLKKKVRSGKAPLRKVVRRLSKMDLMAPHLDYSLIEVVLSTVI